MLKVWFSISFHVKFKIVHKFRSIKESRCYCCFGKNTFSYRRDSPHTVKPVLSGHSKKTKIGFQDQLLLNEGQKYCRMLQGEHSAILSAFIKLPFVIKIFVLFIFEWPLKTGFTV